MKTHLAWVRVGLGALLSGLAMANAYSQGTIGFSAQTQPSIIKETQWLKVEDFKTAHDVPSNLPPKDSIGLRSYRQAKKLLFIQPTRVQTAPSNGLDISDKATLLTEYDDVNVAAASRTGTDTWKSMIGIVTDGDFNKTLTNSSTQSPKSGSLGVDAVWLKPVYYTYTYTAEENRYISELTGEQTVLRPVWAFNALMVLFSGSPDLSTGVKANATAPKAGAPSASLTQQRLFGQSLLTPTGFNYGNGVALTTNATWYPGWLNDPKLGITFSASVVQNSWNTRDTTTAVNILAPSVGFNWRLVEGHFTVGGKDSYLLVQPFARYTMRYLFGDVGSHTRLLADAIGTTQRDFHGIDIGITFTVDAVRFTANVPIIFGQHIEGFTQGQPVLGFGIAAAIRLTN